MQIVGKSVPKTEGVVPARKPLLSDVLEKNYGDGPRKPTTIADEIDSENRMRIAAMSPEEILAAQGELRASLPAAFVARLASRR